MGNKRETAVIIGNRTILCLAVILCVLLASTILLSLGTTSQVAYAESASQGDDIRGYIDNEYNIASELVYTGNPIPYEVDIFGDDPIVKYIPRELFMTENTTLKIHKDYGYFIHTFRDWSYINEEALDNMHSFVLAFAIDFITGKDGFETKDRFSYTITPLFQREYFAVMPNGTVDYITLGFFSNADIIMNASTWEGFLYAAYASDYVLHYNVSSTIDISQGVIVPAPQRNDNASYQCDLFYGEINLFNLADITIAANIFNGQDLNEGDSGYDVLNDDGNFIIRTGIDIKATEFTGEYDFDAVAKDAGYFALKKIVSMVIGWIPGVGSYINNALDVAEFIRETENHYYGDRFESVDYSSYYASTVYANSKHSQMELTGGKLCRSSAITTSAMDGVEAWLRVGDYFTGTFEVSGSTGNEPGWYTIAKHSIALSVKCLISDFPTVSGTSDFFANDFNELRGKPISENVASEAYIMAMDGDIEGKDSFAFTAPRNGLYEVSLTNGTGVNYQVKNDVDKTVREPISGGMYYFEEGQEYIIELTNTTSSLKRPTVKVGMATLEADFGDNYTFTLPAGEEMYVKLNLVNPFTRLSVQGTGMKLTGTSDRLDFMLDEMSETAYDISAAKVTFIRIENTSTAAQEGSITFSDIAQITPGGENAVTIDGNSKYFKFVPEAASYIFRYENATGAAVNFTVYSPGTAAAISDIQGDYVLVTGLTAGSVYWIGLYNAYGSDADITLINEAQNGSIQWAINDEVVTGSSYNMYNGQTYDVALMINGEKYYAHIEVGTIAGGEYLTYQNEVLMVANYSSAEVLPTSIRFEVENFIFAGVGSEIIDGLLDVYLKNPVNYIKANGALKIQDTLSHETEVDVTMYVGDPLIEGVDYKVTYTNGLLQECEIVGSAQVVELTDDSLSTFSFDCNALLTYDPLIRITGIVYDGYEYSYSSSDTESSFNILYGKGSGTSSDPYIINCNQHYATFMLGATSDASNQTVTYWKLTEDLDISSFSGGIPSEFYGVFDGGGHTLSGLTIEIPAESFTSDKSYGWFEENYGTIKNVTFSDVTISAPVWHQGAWVFVGTVVGINRPGGVIDNVDLVGADININRNMARIGGIAGVNFSVIKNCTVGDFDSAVNMFGNGDMGAICGESSGTIENCVSVAQMDHYPSVANRSVGGIVGYAPSGSIIDCSMLLAQIKVTGSDANICPNIGAVAGHITSSTVISGGVPLILITLDALSEAQKVNCCTDGSRLYGYMG